MKCEMQTASSRMRIWAALSISYDDKLYATKNTVHVNLHKKYANTQAVICFIM